MKINRREFLQVSAGIGTGLVLGGAIPAFGTIPVCGNTPPGKDANPYLNGTAIIDAHAHPSQFYYGGLGIPYGKDDPSSTVKQLCEYGVEASVFAAAGDFVARNNSYWTLHFANDFDATEFQLSSISTYLNDITIVDRTADIPGYSPTGVKPGAIMAIEGGEALQGDPNLVNYFHQHHYVRMITLVHRTSNTHPMVLGDQMTDTEVHGGLSPLGIPILERMMQLNMVIDVAHTSTKTLFEVCHIARTAGVPVIDSHTSLWHNHYILPSSGFTRMRTLHEMEAIASTGGLVCTWPLWCYTSCQGERIDVDHWAAEIEFMMAHIGPAHVALGTDGGGRLPRRVNGFANMKDLGYLASAMAAHGISGSDIYAYMGGNIYRVLTQVLQ